MKTVAFFGHRRIFNKFLIEERLNNILQNIIPNGFSKLLVGCHGDFDNIVLSTCLNYKKKFDCDIKINVIMTSLSFINKDKHGFCKADNYKDKDCDTIFYEIEEIYFKNRISFSNRKMIDNSDLIISYVDMTSCKSGAKSAVLYAIKQNKKVINLFKKEDILSKQ